MLIRLESSLQKSFLFRTFEPTDSFSSSLDSFLLLVAHLCFLLGPNSHVHTRISNERHSSYSAEENGDPETDESELEGGEELELVEVDESSEDGGEVVEGEGERADEGWGGEFERVVEVVELRLNRTTKDEESVR